MDGTGQQTHNTDHISTYFSLSASLFTPSAFRIDAGFRCGSDDANHPRDCMERDGELFLQFDDQFGDGDRFRLYKEPEDTRMPVLSRER